MKRRRIYTRHGVVVLPGNSLASRDQKKRKGSTSASRSSGNPRRFWIQYVDLNGRLAHTTTVGRITFDIYADSDGRVLLRRYVQGQDREVPMGTFRTVDEAKKEAFEYLATAN